MLSKLPQQPCERWAGGGEGTSQSSEEAATCSDCLPHSDCKLSVIKSTFKWELPAAQWALSTCCVT